MPRVMEGFNSNLRSLRVDRGMTAEEVAERTGIGRASIYDYESGKRMFNADRLWQFADLYGVSADAVLGRKFLGSGSPAEVVRAHYESPDLAAHDAIRSFARALESRTPGDCLAAARALARIADDGL